MLVGAGDNRRADNRHMLMHVSINRAPTTTVNPDKVDNAK